MAVPELERVIEPGSQDRRWFTRVLRGTEYYNRLRWPRLIT
jgi:hypothetical protein